MQKKSNFTSFKNATLTEEMVDHFSGRPTPKYIQKFEENVFNMKFEKAIKIAENEWADLKTKTLERSSDLDYNYLFEFELLSEALTPLYLSCGLVEGAKKIASEDIANLDLIKRDGIDMPDEVTKGLDLRRATLLTVLGTANEMEKDLTKALIQHMRAEAFMKAIEMPDQALMVSYWALSLIHEWKGWHDKSIDYFMGAFQFGINTSRFDHPFATTILHPQQIFTKKPEGLMEALYSLPDSEERDQAITAQSNENLDADIKGNEVFLSLQKKNLGKDNQYLALKMLQLSVLFRRNGELEKAESYLKEAREISSYNQSHGYNSTLIKHQAFIEIERSNYDGALELLNKSLGIRQKCYGENSIFDALTKYDIGYTHWFKGDFKKALEEFSSSEKLLKNIPEFAETDAATTISESINTVESLLQNDKF